MRYGLAILIIAFLAIVGTVVLVSNGNGTSDPAKVARLTKLADYDTKDSASVSWTVQGRLVGESERNAIRITITRQKRTFEVLSGYAERVERSSEFASSPESFAAFTRALDTANFGKERAVRQADERGFCPKGNRFIYRLTDSGNEIMRTWSDTCLAADGPFGGGQNSTLIQHMFKAQIPAYTTLANGVKL